MSFVGYGVTAWSRRMKTGHLDGISVYTQALFRALSRENVSIQPMAFGQTLPHFEGQCTRSLGRSFLKQLVLPSQMKQPLPQLFHATDHYIPQFKNIPVIATIMDVIPLLYPAYASGRYRQIKNWAFARSILSAQHWITISEQSKRDLVQVLDLEPDSISVIPLAVDSIYFQQKTDLEKRAVFNKHFLNPGFFLFVGTLQPRKNLEALLDAHALLPKAYQLAHPLVIVGASGWKIAHLRSRLQVLERMGTVRCLNYLPQDEVIVLLQSALALMFVSLYEGFGLPVLEAFASNCPVIASNTTSIPEVAGDAAVLVPPTSVDEIREAMLNRIEHKLNYQALQEKGRMRAQAFTWERCASMTLSVYQQVGG